jgi:predicted lipid-binding transport protein (Tim44 family)
MRSPILIALATLALVAVASCNTSQPASNASNASSAQSAQSSNSPQTVVVPPITSAHGGGNANAATAVATSVEKPSMATPELDLKIAKAEAAAYVERADVFYSAQQPMLYKFALGDFRRALRYDPKNEEARAKLDQIVSIYQSMGKPVPTNGQEQ